LVGLALVVDVILQAAARQGERVWPRENDGEDFFAFPTYSVANLFDSCTL
jgi:hypothetical protein